MVYHVIDRVSTIQGGADFPKNPQHVKCQIQQSFNRQNDDEFESLDGECSASDGAPPRGWPELAQSAETACWMEHQTTQICENDKTCNENKSAFQIFSKETKQCLEIVKLDSPQTYLK